MKESALYFPRALVKASTSAEETGVARAGARWAGLEGTESAEAGVVRIGVDMTARIEMPREALAEFCRKHHVRKLALFGSVLRDDFRPDSDVDVLVEFEPGTRAGYLKLAGMELELSELVGRKVDLRTPGELSRYFRDEVLAKAEVQFGA